MASGRLAAAVPPRVRLPAEQVLHLLEAHAGHGDGRGAPLLEAGLEVERDQEVLADEQRAAEARHAAQVLQVAPQQDGALALLAAVAVHRQHVDVHGGGAGDVLGHGLLQGAEGRGPTFKQELKTLIRGRKESLFVAAYLRQPLLVPPRADDEGHQLAFLEPAQRQLGTLAQEAEHVLQIQRALTRHRHEG